MNQAEIAKRLAEPIPDPRWFAVAGFAAGAALVAALALLMLG